MLDNVVLRRGRWTLFIAAAVWLLSGCSDDLYADCQPDEELNCDQSYSCIAEPDFQCSTQVCGKFQGSRPFCTQTCTSNGDCEGGKCRRFVLGRDQKYCVPNNQIEDDEGNGGPSGGGREDAGTSGSGAS